MMKCAYFWVSSFFIVSSAFCAAVPKIEVKISSKVKHLKITSKGDFDFHFLRGFHKHKSTQKKLEFDCDFKIASKDKSVLFASLVSKNPDHDLVFGERRFGGHLKLATSTSRGCDVIQSIKLNKYLETLLSKEMNGSWPIEALKAQAVAARSYAIDKINNSNNSNFNIISGEIHQVSGSMEDVTARTIKAVNETLGEVLVNEDKTLVPGYYHAECGGKTLDPIDVWSGHMFDYQPAKCPYCHSKTKIKKWYKKISSNKMLNFLSNYYGISIKKIKSVNIVDSGKIHLRVNKRDFIFLPSDLRKFVLSLGIKSNNFRVSKYDGENFFITGSGRGHGVGMCQLGALKMAELGFNYRKILKFYYPKLAIKKLY